MPVFDARFYRYCIVIIAMLACKPGYSMTPASFESSGMEATLSIQRLKINLDVDDSIIESRINRIGLILYEPGNQAFQAGLQAGALEINQTDNPVTTGINITGNYLGILFRSLLFRHGHSGLQLKGSYTYHDADKLLSDQEINFRWHELLLNVNALLAYENFNLALGGYSYLIDGDETDFGSITQTREFTEDEKTGVHLGFEYRVDATGRVGIHVDSGARRGVGLVFTREF